MNEISSMYQMVNSFPMLKDGEEEELWIEYFDENTKGSRKKIIRDKMITSHLRMALKGARKWMGSKLPLQDLFGQAQEGLIHAFDKFSVEHEVKFATYAPWWIEAKVNGYVMDNVSTVKMGTTAFSKYLFFNYIKLRNEQEIENPDLNRDQIDVMVAKKLIKDEKSPSGDLEKTLQQIKDFKIKKSAAASLDAPVSDEGEGASFIDYIVDPNMRPALDIIQEDEEKRMGRDFLVSAREKFIRIGKEREWEILKARRLDEPPKTLEDLSPIYGVSRERVRQIEVRALERLKGMAKKDFKAMSLQEEHPSRAVKRKPKKSRVAIPAIPARPKPNPVKMIKPNPINQVTESYKMETKVIYNISDKINDMVEKLIGFDLSEEDYPYIPKTVGDEELYSAIAQFAMGKKDYFERATKVINGVEHPQKGRWIYVGPSVGQPKFGKSSYTKEEKENIVKGFLSLYATIVENELEVDRGHPHLESPEKSKDSNKSGDVEKDDDSSSVVIKYQGREIEPTYSEKADAIDNSDLRNISLLAKINPNLEIGSSYLNQKLSMKGLLDIISDEDQAIPLANGRGKNKKIIGYFIGINQSPDLGIGKEELSFGSFKKKSSQYANSKNIIVLKGHGIDKSILFIPKHLFNSAKNIETSVAESKDDLQVSVTSSGQSANTSTLKEKTKIQKPVSTEPKIGNSLDIASKAFLPSYTPSKSKKTLYDYLDNVPEEAYNQFRTLWMRSKSASASTIKRAEEELKNIEKSYPSTPYYKIFCASVGVEVQDFAYFLKYGDINRPQDMQLIPNTWDEFVALDLSRHEWPLEAGEVEKTPPSKQRTSKTAVNPQEDFKSIVRAQDKQKDALQLQAVNNEQLSGVDTSQTCLEAPAKGSDYSFLETRSVPYKPWTLNLGDEKFHLGNAVKKFVEYVLNEGKPQSKDQLAQAGISFNGPLQDKLKDTGLLKVYSKQGVGRIAFYGIATENYNPQHVGYSLRGVVQADVNNTKTSKTTVRTITKETPEAHVTLNENLLTIGALVITPSNNTVSYKGETLSHVRSKPYEALILMAKKHGDFVTKEELSNHFFGNDDEKSVAQIDRGMKGLGALIDRTVPNLSQSLIMKVGDKGYALTLSLEDRHAVYEKAGIKNPLVKQKVKFASPHDKPKDSGKAVDSMNGASANIKHQPQQQGGGRRSMAEQLANFTLK